MDTLYSLREGYRQKIRHPLNTELLPLGEMTVRESQTAAYRLPARGILWKAQQPGGSSHFDPFANIIIQM